MQLDNAGQPPSAIADTAKMCQVLRLPPDNHSSPKPYCLPASASTGTKTCASADPSQQIKYID